MAFIYLMNAIPLPLPLHKAMAQFQRSAPLLYGGIGQGFAAWGNLLAVAFCSVVM
jgi:hypothetical protein